MKTPTPNQIRNARQDALHTNQQMAKLLHVSLATVIAWQAPKGKAKHRVMPKAYWELYRIKTGHAKTLESNNLIYNHVTDQDFKW